MRLEKIGELSFLAVFLIAIVTGLVAINSPFVPALLVVLGLIVGLLNISEKETTPFLVASIALLAAATVETFSVIPSVGAHINTIVNNIATFVAPAAVIVAIKAIYALASRK